VTEGESEKSSNGVESMLDMEMIKCLDSVHQLLSLRDTLSQLLRQGWMEMASARYSMGPQVSQPLFRLKPYAASASISITDDSNDNDEASIVSDGPFHMTLQRLETGDLSNGKVTGPSNKVDEPSRQGQEQSNAVPTDWTQEEDAAYKRLMRDVDDLDSDSESGFSTQAKEKAKPLHWFGGLVSPHLRAAQGSFQLALEVLVDMANAQGEAAHAHKLVLQEHGCTREGSLTGEAPDTYT